MQVDLRLSGLKSVLKDNLWSNKYSRSFTKLTILLLLCTSALGWLATDWNQRQMRTITNNIESYIFLTNLIQSEQSLFEKQEEGKQILHLAAEAATRGELLEHTKWPLHFNFLVLLDSEGRIVAGQSRILDRQSSKVKEPFVMPQDDGTGGQWWLPTNQPPAPGSASTYRLSSVQVGKKLLASIVRDSRKYGKTLSGFELLDGQDLYTLGLAEQAGFYRARPEDKQQLQGLASVTVERTGSYWLMGGFLLNSDPRIVDKASFLSGGRIMSIYTRSGQRISTTLSNDNGVRSLGGRLSDEVYDQTVLHSGTFYGRVKQGDRDYLFSANPIYDHNLGLLPHPRPTGALEVGMTYARFERLIDDNKAGIVRVSLFGLLALVGIGGLTIALVLLLEGRMVSLQRSKDLTLENAGNGIIGFDSRGICTFVNSAALEMLERDRQELIAHNCLSSVLSLLASGDAKAQSDLKYAIQLREASHLKEAWLTRRDGTQLPVAAKLSSSQDKRVATIISLSDLSEQKRAEKESHHAAVLAERNRIAADIHDNLGNLFAGLHYQCEALCKSLDQPQLDPKALKQIAALARQTAADGVRTMQQSLWTLSTSLNYEDLPRCIEGCLERLCTNSRIQSSFVQNGELPHLNDQIKKQLALIAYEAITNAVKHSGGTKITVKLSYEPQQIVLQVMDNGKGLELSGSREGKSGNGLGLASIAERARSIGGRLIMDTVPFQGTSISVCLPMGFVEDFDDE